MVPTAETAVSWARMTGRAWPTPGRCGSGGQGDGAQHLGNAPGLGDAAARRIGRLGVKDLADRSQAELAKVRLEAAERPACASPVSGYTFSQASTNGPLSQAQTVP